MKLAKRAEIDAFFAKPSPAILGALIYGKDRSQVIERATGLARQIVSDINDPFNVSVLTDTDIDNDPARLEGELQALSMMGGRRLVRLKFFSEKAALDKAVAATLKAHAAGDFNREAFIVIEAGGLGADSALRRLADSDKSLVSIACYEDETGDVVRMARETLSANGVALSTAAMDIFVQRLPKERGIARQEIERLILFIGPGSHKTLSEVELQDFLGVEPEASLFKAAADAFGGRMKATQAGLRRAFAEGESGADALRALSQHYNKLKLLKSLLEKGAGTKEATRAAGVFWKDENDMLRQAQAWSFPPLDALAADLIQADKACKSTGMPDLLISERLYLQVAGKAARAGL
ncbi:DNA polymerase III subunit delta [Asticcacaulis sp. EMRT-3]|uniref:DNA polymerase III subunit delta n=1 Tax=Asticcacaulis sp. EMRT-3 TaxID=3040349 RepID=UPI0024AF9B69|nr:DNA polymerase III subunit delta [Asticcacaulis sp. EMRT-3]MDI7775809.1 DNA polymerase III subunit delta [Asticcacaulis sp. EMRT-3]